MLHYCSELNDLIIVCHLNLSNCDRLISFQDPPRCFANVSYYIH